MKVQLYEDNAGHLFLVHAGNVWMGLEQTGSTFRVDAECILKGETDDWTVSMFNVGHTNIEEVCQLVASFNESITIHSKPGAAASEYILGVHPEEWVFTKDETGPCAIVYAMGKPFASYPLVEMG
jgi:hypothetical protein